MEKKKKRGGNPPSQKGRKNPNGGRKQWDGKDHAEVLGKLEQAFAIGASDLEACSFADISAQALYDYQNKDPSFLLRKEKLKQRPILKARQEVVKGLSDNPEFSLKYLERKRKKEFSTYQRHLHGEDQENPFHSLSNAAKSLNTEAGDSTVEEQSSE